MSVIHVTKDNFQQLVLDAENKVLLDFWATWCGPCQMIAPVLEEIAADNESVTVAKINVDEEMELAMQFGITSIPTLIVMDKGQPVGKMIGFRPKADIEKLLG